MKKLFILLLITVSLYSNDIIVKQSNCSLDDTVENIRNILRAKGLSIFATINHGGNAKSIGMNLNASKMIVFGNPKLGTSLMQQDMRIGLDLPLRILVYTDVDGSTKMAYRDGSWLANKHVLNIPKKIQKINQAMDSITTKAGSCIIE